MTVKGDDPDVTAKSKNSYEAAQEPEIPVAFASVLDEKPAATTTAPGYVADDPIYEPTATTIIPQASSTAAPPAAGATIPNTMEVHGDTVPVVGGNTNKPPTTSTTTTSRPIPPNAPPDGNWVRYKYAGQQTWGMIGAGGCALFWCCAVVLAPCALFGLFCPCDEKEGYMSPSGVIYDERGRAVGDRRRNKFVVVAKA